MEALTHGLETVTSPFDRVNKQLAHPLIGKKMDTAVKKPDHNTISLVCSIWYLI